VINSYIKRHYTWSGFHLT